MSDFKVVRRCVRPQSYVVKLFYIVFKYAYVISPVLCCCGRGPWVVVSTAAFHATVRGSFPSLGGLKKTKTFLPHPLVKLSIVESLHDQELACSASDLQGLNFKFWREVSSHISHHSKKVLLVQFSLYVHKSGLMPDSFHFLLCCCILFSQMRMISVLCCFLIVVAVRCVNAVVGKSRISHFSYDFFQ